MLVDGTPDRSELTKVVNDESEVFLNKFSEEDWLNEVDDLQFRKSDDFDDDWVTNDEAEDFEVKKLLLNDADENSDIGERDEVKERGKVVLDRLCDVFKVEGRNDLDNVVDEDDARGKVELDECVDDADSTAEEALKQLSVTDTAPEEALKQFAVAEVTVAEGTLRVDDRYENELSIQCEILCCDGGDGGDGGRCWSFARQGENDESIDELSILDVKERVREWWRARLVCWVVAFSNAYVVFKGWQRLQGYRIRTSLWVDWDSIELLLPVSLFPPPYDSTALSSAPPT